MRRTIYALAATLLALTCSQGALAQDMTFFITSEGLGNGGDLGGIEGADAHCQALAEAAGAGDKTWHAYLGTETEGGRGIDARSRIGEGPWHNANGDLIAENLDQLHVNANVFASTGLDENGDRVNARGDQPNMHDILTGSMADGTAYFPDDADHTCNNWTSSSEGSAQVGHHDRNGGGNTSWNSAHASRSCSQEDLQATGGAGLLYCFAAE